MRCSSPVSSFGTVGTEAAETDDDGVYVAAAAVAEGIAAATTFADGAHHYCHYCY